MAVLRLTTSGAIDTSYGLGTGASRVNYGALVPGATGSEDYASSVALQPDGKIVLAGESNAAGNNDMALVRLRNPEGTIDTSYGLGTGASRLDLGGQDVASDMALQPDGRILLAGRTTVGSGFDTAVARVLSPQGTFDASFHGDGRGVYNFAGLVQGATGKN